ncbi:hypothetical protein CC78DRAFT_512095 [Lojkania enalia]|uniref:Beta-hexosaminidase n=1 Tax=Lojkania enalia TaxID=147567 RepID=A0A9P4KIQ6_9PLEO|nr:hypothetical protein CC78DRAFT_512095 [Didymosphaeria enalia]
MRFLPIIPLFASVVPAIWPKPIHYEYGQTILWVSKDVSVFWTSAGDYDRNFQGPTISSTPSGDEIVDFALQKTWEIIFEKSFVPWKLNPKSWQEPDPSEAVYITDIHLKLLKNDPENVAKPLAGEVDESYRLSLTTDGTVSISANSSIGLTRGLSTFTQLFYWHSQGGAYTPLAPVEIFDSPKFQHRGLNLDVSRNWFSVEDIKRTIDAVAYNKMNRFHLHITDSQSFPLEIPSLPELAEKGAYRPGLTYSPDNFKEIQYHAAIQGVELITEIDMPGHTSSIWFSYPELITAFNVQPNWNTYAAEPPSGTLKLNSTAVNNFLETLFKDLLPRVLPYSSYFHTGGDEVNKKAYETDETVQSSDFAVLQPLMQKFIDRNHKHVRSYNLTPIVWEEMLLDWDLDLGPDVIIQTWKSDSAVAKVVSKGHKALVGNYKYWYLDCGKGQWLDFDPSISSTFYPYNDYCAPFHNWRLMYSYDPLANIPPEHQHLVLGGEAHMWAEQTDPVNMDQAIWPRTSAAAEVLWSGAKDEYGRNRSQIDASPRLSEFRERLVAMGIAAEPIQMHYCTMNGTQCQLGYSMQGLDGNL